MPRRALNHDELAPLNLQAIIYEHGINQKELGEAVIQTAGPRRGQPLSPTSISMLVNHGRFPSRTPTDYVKENVEQFLRDAGVTDSEIERAWDRDNAQALDPDSLPKSMKLRTGGNSEDSEEGDIETTLNLPETEMLSRQAQKHFEVLRNPFIDDVQGPDDVYLSTEQRYIRESMRHTAKHGGFLAVVGESGAGKTTLRRDLIDHIHRVEEPIVVIQPQTIDKTRLTAAHICDAIAADLGGQTKYSSSLEAKARSVQAILTESSRAGNSHVLVIEEAHDLAIPTLKYLKRFWELEDGFKKLMAIILIGQLELGDRLNERVNPQMREVIRRCEIARLEPLNGDLEEYLGLKFKRVGLTLTKVFSKDAYDAIRDRLTISHRGLSQPVSMLYPLVVHRLVTAAMNRAAEIGEPTVSAAVVESV